jgi:hypothetical protein
MYKNSDVDPDPHMALYVDADPDQDPTPPLRHLSFSFQKFQIKHGKTMIICGSKHKNDRDKQPDRKGSAVPAKLF